tara:strand:- start:17 stop:439 length:423 start_codon:yes stop_codon:yes gene_type:complete
VETLIKFLSENIFQILALGVVLYLLGNESKQRAFKYLLEPADVSIRLHQGFSVFDIRDNDLFKKGHLPGSKHLTMEKIKSKIQKAAEKNTSMNAIVVTENGNELDELFKDTKARAIDCYVLKGGYKQWVDAGLLINQVSS